MGASKLGRKVLDIFDFDPVRRVAWSMTSWFCIPEQGMKALEVLCRASAFLIKVKNPKFGKKYHVVTVSHCIAPWRWPNYYPDAWVQFVNANHTQFTLDLRSNDGQFITHVECIPRSYHHKTKDLAVLHIADEDRMIKELDRIFKTTDFNAEDLLPTSVEITPANELEFQGHSISNQASDYPANDDDEDRRIPVPCSIPGKVFISTARQIFATTITPITLGMCGGPVLVRRSDLNQNQQEILDKELQNLSASQTTDHRYVYGMMDGITAPSAEEKLRDKASIIEARDIERFLRVIEDENEGELTEVVSEHPMEPVTALDSDSIANK